MTCRQCCRHVSLARSEVHQALDPTMYSEPLHAAGLEQAQETVLSGLPTYARLHDLNDKSEQGCGGCAIRT